MFVQVQRMPGPSVQRSRRRPASWRSGSGGDVFAQWDGYGKRQGITRTRVKYHFSNHRQDIKEYKNVVLCTRITWIYKTHKISRNHKKGRARILQTAYLKEYSKSHISLKIYLKLHITKWIKARDCVIKWKGVADVDGCLYLVKKQAVLYPAYTGNHSITSSIFHHS